MIELCQLTFVLQADKVHELAETIGRKLAEAELQGQEGNVEESIKVMQEVEDIRKQKLQAEVSYFITLKDLTKFRKQKTI